VLFIEAYPSKSCGWKDHARRSGEVQDWVKKIRDSFSTCCSFAEKPTKDHSTWYKTIQSQSSIEPYLKFESPNKFVTQVRYQAKDAEILIFINSNTNESYQTRVKFSKGIVSGKQAWIWDPESGERSKLDTVDDTVRLDLGPADLKLLVFDKEKKGTDFKAIGKSGQHSATSLNQWSVTGRHLNGTTIKKEMNSLQDLKEITEWTDFGGNIIYQTNLAVPDKSKVEWLDLGKVFGVSELVVNGQNAGVKWYGKRIYNIGRYLKNGENSIEVRMTTTLGNFLKSLKDNRVGQYWTNEGRTIQPIQSMGLVGPVQVY